MDFAEGKNFGNEAVVESTKIAFVDEAIGDVSCVK